MIPNQKNPKPPSYQSTQIQFAAFFYEFPIKVHLNELSFQVL